MDHKIHRHTDALINSSPRKSKKKQSKKKLGRVKEAECLNLWHLQFVLGNTISRGRPEPLKQKENIRETIFACHYFYITFNCISIHDVGIWYLHFLSMGKRLFRSGQKGTSQNSCSLTHWVFSKNLNEITTCCRIRWTMFKKDLLLSKLSK